VVFRAALMAGVRRGGGAKDRSGMVAETEVVKDCGLVTAKVTLANGEENKKAMTIIASRFTN